MYQGLYDYANRNAVNADIYAGKANWPQGSKVFAKPIKARSSSAVEMLDISKTHDGERSYPGLYAFAKTHFVKRDLVLEYFEATPTRPLPEWVCKLSRGPRAFRNTNKNVLTLA